MPTQIEMVDPASTTLEYENLQARTETQYYLHYGFDLIIITAIAVLFIKILTWKNWLSEIIKK